MTIKFFLITTLDSIPRHPVEQRVILATLSVCLLGCGETGAKLTSGTERKNNKK
jgi:hypothetical protein